MLKKFLALQKEIENICKRIGSDPEKINILAATKYTDTQGIEAALKAGIRLIGENRIQDAQKKFANLPGVRKHFIGHLQQNKVKIAVKIFDAIESVDSLPLAEKIDQECQKIDKIMPIFLEINIAQDPQKFGRSETEVIPFLNELKKYKHLECKGFMTIVPFSTNPEEARPYFKKMKTLFDQCKKKFPELETLSMGMSHDYKIAVEEGSTEIRMGSYFFS